MDARVIVKPILLPLSWVYGGVVSLRNALFDRGLLSSVHSVLPTICVGNATVGGTGKSPTAVFLAQGLFERGFRPVILSRGYGGQLSGPHLLHTHDTVEAVGEEVLMQKAMLGDNAEIVVAHDRRAGVKFIEQRDLGDVVILDDGYQHRRLARDVNLLLVERRGEQDPLVELRRESLLPAGRLRESLRQALRRASAIIFVNKGAVGPAHTPTSIDLPNWNLGMYPEEIVDVMSGDCFPLQHLFGKALHAVTAIAQPESFLRMLKQTGYDLRESSIYRDHYHFSADDWRKLLAQGKPWIATEKDAVKLRPFVERPGELFFLRLATKMEAEDTFWGFVLERIQQRNG